MSKEKNLQKELEDLSLDYEDALAKLKAIEQKMEDIKSKQKIESELVKVVCPTCEGTGQFDDDMGVKDCPSCETKSYLIGVRWRGLAVDMEYFDALQFNEVFR